MNQPYFKNRPIASTASLARALRISNRQLLWATDRADGLYRALPPETKSDGGIRQLYDPAPPLKDIQRRINRHIFGRVDFPFYLQGGIRDRINPRHCLANAKLHLDAKIVINEDISGFFPSITERQVQAIWQHFFCFPPDIAIILTKLTTLDGQLPQGAPTSSYLANLVLWNNESLTVQTLFERGFRYSRYVDDITLSSTYFQPGRNKTTAIKAVKSMCERNNFHVKRSKHRIESSGEPMRVNNLQINNGVSLPKKERARIRAAVNSCENYPRLEGSTNNYRKLFDRTLGRVNYLRQFHPHKGQQLLNRLEACSPL